MGRPGHDRRVAVLRSATCVGITLVLVGCGGGSSHSSSTSASSSSPTTAAAAVTTSGAASSVATAAPASSVASAATSRPPAPATNNLGALIIPAPDGYAASTSSDATNGPVSAADFDKQVGQTGAATHFGFVRGYDETYESSTSAYTVEVTLATFASPADAVDFVSTAVQAIVSTNTDQAPTQHAYSSIAGAVEVDGTKLGSDGSIDYDVIAAKGPTFMAIDYNIELVGAPAVLPTWVAEQYARL